MDARANVFALGKIFEGVELGIEELEKLDFVGGANSLECIDSDKFFAARFDVLIEFIAHVGILCELLLGNARDFPQLFKP